MPNLLTIFQDMDLSFLQNISHFWGIELIAPDDISAKNILIESIIKNPNQVFEMTDSLPEDAKKAFDTILENDGRMTWTKFTRTFGDVRNMGSAKRERERPDLHPISPAEKLWYRGLIGKGFLKNKDEPQEFVFIPDEFFDLLKPNTDQFKSMTFNTVSHDLVLPKKMVNDNILHDACTMLAGLRMGMSETEIQSFLLEIPYSFLYALLKVANIIKPNGQIDSDATRIFLETPRNVSIQNFFDLWVESNEINEILFLPKLVIENKVDNNPKQNRSFILEKIIEIYTTSWWKENSFVSKIKQEFPDFLRPTGNYDTWIIKNIETNNYLKGFDHWDQVEGQYIRFLINGPLQWLGFIETGEVKEEKAPACRISKWGIDLSQKKFPNTTLKSEEKPKIDRYGKIIVSKKVSLALRYQISRFCDWKLPDRNEYHYQITPNSITQAQQVGLNSNQFLALIQKAVGQIPPSVKSVFENWEKNKVENFIKKVTLLRVSNPELLKKLMEGNSSKFIKEILTPSIAIIHTGSENNIENAIFELGYFTDWVFEKVA